MAAAQISVAARAYDVEDAYQIYNLLLPQEESFSFAKETLVIREETESVAGIPKECLTPEAAKRFRDAIVVFNRIGRTRWLLQPRFRTEKAYKLYGPDISDQPRSAAPSVAMSVVGFNPGRTRAVVYISSSCGGFCGSAKYHLLERVQGKWKEVLGVTCSMAS
jgi:hypothetical protein